MSETLDKLFFDLSMRVLNYSIEFVESPGYASLRLLDVLEILVGLSPRIEGVSNREFYEKLKRKFEQRRLMVDSNEQAKFLDELLSLFVEEWRKTR